MDEVKKIAHRVEEMLKWNSTNVIELSFYLAKISKQAGFYEGQMISHEKFTKDWERNFKLKEAYSKGSKRIVDYIELYFK